MEKGKYSVVALGELLIDFTENGISGQGNPLLEANPGGAPCNVLAMLQNFGHKTAFIGKVGKDSFGELLRDTIVQLGIDATGLLFDEEIPTTLAFAHTHEDGDRSFCFYRKPGADVMLKEDGKEVIETVHVNEYVKKNFYSDLNSCISSNILNDLSRIHDDLNYDY